MGLFNPTENSIHLKIVYYGPAFGGKTTNLKGVRSLLDETGEQQVVSVDTGTDTTLFFDYLPLRFRLLDKYQIKVQGYTVPGQVRYDTTRRLVLKGADGVVFVADSRRDRREDNVRSLANLHDNLRRIGMDGPQCPPIVIQYNKRDVPDALSEAELCDALASTQRVAAATHPAVAIDGVGVFESFRDVLLATLERAYEDFQLDRQGLTREQLLEAVETALTDARSAARAQPAANPPDRMQVRVPTAPDVGREGEVAEPEELLQSAVSAQLELAALSGDLAERFARQRERGDRLLELGQRAVHDLRKPLTALTNLIHLLRTRDGGNEIVQMSSEIVAEMARQLDDCAEQFADSASASVGDEAVELESLVTDVQRRLVPYATQFSVELKTSGLAELPTIRGNRSGLTSVFTNLVGNAIKYHDPEKNHRQVLVRGRVTDHGLLIGVSDNGIGIAASDRRAAFTKYHRSRHATSLAEGSGLGLHITREIVRAHGGRVGVRSVPGAGSLFYVLLPDRVGAETAPVSSPAAVAAAGSG